MSGLYNSRAKTPDNTKLHVIAYILIFGAPALALWFFVDTMKPDKPPVVSSEPKAVKVDRTR